MLEIEVKAWAPDLDLVRSRLRALGKTPDGDPVVKEDAYFCAPDADPRTCDPTRDRILRVRREGGPGAVLTAKRKKVEHGVETNDEIEVETGDGASLLRLVEYLGFRPFLRKAKETETWPFEEGLKVELNRLSGLGDFVEVESLVQDAAPVPEIERARARVRAVLSLLGVAEERIEPRLYMDLLRERGVGLA